MHHFYFCCFLKGSTRKKKSNNQKQTKQPTSKIYKDSAEGKLQPFQYTYVLTGRKENECIFHIESINHGT